MKTRALPFYEFNEGIYEEEVINNPVSAAICGPLLEKVRNHSVQAIRRVKLQTVLSICSALSLSLKEVYYINYRCYMKRFP